MDVVHEGFEGRTELITNWYVITGGPSSGKSRLVSALAFAGFATRPEAARILIDEDLSNGLSVSQIRGDDLKFQTAVLQMKRAAEAHATPNDLIFWDRGIPDSIPYLTRCGGDPTIVTSVGDNRRYRGVFLLEPPATYEPDYARTESTAEAELIHAALASCYSELGYAPITIPATPISQRVKFILSEIAKTTT